MSSLPIHKRQFVLVFNIRNAVRDCLADHRHRIRSYRQHFDIWGVGKYTCKKREERRRRSVNKSLSLSPSQSLADVIIKQEEASSPASSSGSSPVSRRSSDQKPLPVLKQPILYPNFFQDQMRSQDDAQAKIDASRAPLWERLDIDMLRSSQNAQAMLPSCVNPSV